MITGTYSSRRFFGVISLLIILGVLNAGLFRYLHQINKPAWSFIEKTNGTILLGNVKLLEGGYLQIDNVYELVYTPPALERRTSEQFQLEALGTGVVRVLKTMAFNNTSIGPTEVKQWGSVPRGSNIEKRLEQFEAEKLAP